MGQVVISTFFASITGTSALLYLDKKYAIKPIFKYFMLGAYIFGISYFTVLDRSPGENILIRLTPFWSYSKFHIAQYRWQIYLNIFLFIPFGFLLPFCIKSSFFTTLCIGLLFSTALEATQYYFSLGLCEFDDVFHNTIGTGLGYGYWKLLNKLYIGLRKKVD